MFSDIFVMTGLGLISPILAIFIKDNLVGGTITSVGIAAMIFVAVKASLQLLFAKVFNPKDRIWMVLLGTILVACVPIVYIFSTQIWHIYLAQVIYGVGGAFAFPAWLSLFTTNLTKGKEGLEWSVYSSCTGVGTALAAFIGAKIAETFGFRTIFAITTIMAVIGGIILIGLERKQENKGNGILDHLFKISPKP